MGDSSGVVSYFKTIEKSLEPLMGKAQGLLNYPNPAEGQAPPARQIKASLALPTVPEWPITFKNPSNPDELIALDSFASKEPSTLTLLDARLEVSEINNGGDRTDQICDLDANCIISNLEFHVGGFLEIHKEDNKSGLKLGFELVGEQDTPLLEALQAFRPFSAIKSPEKPIQGLDLKPPKLCTLYFTKTDTDKDWNLLWWAFERTPQQPWEVVPNLIVWTTEDSTVEWDPAAKDYIVIGSFLVGSSNPLLAKAEVHQPLSSSTLDLKFVEGDLWNILSTLASSSAAAPSGAVPNDEHGNPITLHWLVVKCDKTTDGKTYRIVDFHCSGGFAGTKPPQKKPVNPGKERGREVFPKPGGKDQKQPIEDPSRATSPNPGGKDAKKPSEDPSPATLPNPGGKGKEKLEKDPSHKEPHKPGRKGKKSRRKRRDRALSSTTSSSSSLSTSSDEGASKEPGGPKKLLPSTPVGPWTLQNAELWVYEELPTITPVKLSTTLHSRPDNSEQTALRVRPAAAASLVKEHHSFYFHFKMHVESKSQFLIHVDNAPFKNSLRAWWDPEPVTWGTNDGVPGSGTLTWYRDDDKLSVPHTSFTREHPAHIKIWYTYDSKNAEWSITVFQGSHFVTSMDWRWSLHSDKKLPDPGIAIHLTQTGHLTMVLADGSATATRPNLQKLH